MPITWESACQELGVAISATPEEMRRQYIYKAQLLHPDGMGTKPEHIRLKAEQELMRVNAAYDYLKNSANNPLSNPPKLKLELKHIKFNDVGFGQVKSTTFQIQSIGGTYSNFWIDNAPCPWLKVTQVQSISNTPLPLNVTIQAKGLGDFGGHYECLLPIKLTNERTGVSDEVQLKIELQMANQPLTVEPPIQPKVQPRIITTSPSNFSLKAFSASLGTYLVVPIFSPAIILTLMAWGILDAAGISPYFGVAAYGGFALWKSFEKGYERKTISVSNQQTYTKPVMPPPPAQATNQPHYNTQSAYSTRQVIGNSFRQTYHRPSCEWAQRMSHHNRESLTVEEARQRGYKACRVCRP